MTKLNPNGIDLAAGFEVGSQQPLDSRQHLTKAQMLAINDDIMPSNYFAVCVDDGLFYTYDKNNTPNAQTGKFRVVGSGDAIEYVDELPTTGIKNKVYGKKERVGLLQTIYMVNPAGTGMPTKQQAINYFSQYFDTVNEVTRDGSECLQLLPVYSDLTIGRESWSKPWVAGENFDILCYEISSGDLKADKGGIGDAYNYSATNTWSSSNLGFTSSYFPSYIYYAGNADEQTTTLISNISDGTQLQYETMPVIADDNKDDVIQYIGENTADYHKGSWYGATETTFYRFLDTTNQNSVYSKTLNILPSTLLYDENGDVSSVTVTAYSLEAFTIYGSDGNTYVYQNGSGDITKYVWTELKDSDLTNVVQSLNFSGGKIWRGTQAEYDALPEAIQNNDSIFFYILDGEVSTGIINDEVVSTDTTFSSTKQMATFVTPETTALTNYYKKSDTMSKSEIMQVASKNLECEIVEVLPSSDISTSTIYLIKNGEHYDQYMYINSAWAMIGSTTIDLSDYATKEELDEKQDLLEYDTEPTSGSEKMVKSGGIYNAVNNRLKVVYTMPTNATTAGTNIVLYTGATGEYVQGGIYLWNATTTSWDLISTADVDLDDYLTSWVGTEAQWQALTAEEQAKYTIVNKTDDIGIGDLVVVDAVTNGDMNPVTSNAVYDTLALQNITPTRVNVASNSGVWVKRSGRVVNVNFGALVTLDQTTPAGTILYSGFPVPALDIVRFTLFDATTIDVSSGLVQINTVGNFVADGQGLKPNTAYWGSFTYIAKE